MFSKTVYEKTFPKDPALIALEKQRSADLFNRRQAQYPSFHLMLLDEELRTTYIPRPYKIRKRKRFIDAAIALSDHHQIDLTIVQSKGLVMATFYFDMDVHIQNLSKVMGMADEFTFLTNIRSHHICMTLHYYTHQIIRDGIVLSPE